MRVEIALLLGLALFVSGCDRQSQQPSQAAKQSEPRKAEPGLAPAKQADLGEVDRRQAGKGFPKAGFEAPNGQKVTLADFGGRPVLVNLWATWCGPCVTEMPTLDALAVREADRIQVLTISQDNNRAVVDRWWAKQSYKLLQPYLDARGDFAFSFGSVSLPTSILYDANGKEVWRVAGSLDWTGDEAKSLIDEGFE